MNLDVLFEDNHLLVVNKPAGIATMGAIRGRQSLMDLCKQYLKQKYHKPGNVFLACVSRLDSFVSGVVLFGRTSKAASRLNPQFSQREVQKIYLAIVSGNQIPDQATLRDWIAKDESNHRMVLVRTAPGDTGRSSQSPSEAQVSDKARQTKLSSSGDPHGAEAQEAKYAELAFQTIQKTADQSLLQVDLRTGRKHQIRVQLSGRGWPILGDRKYGSRIPWAANAIALHALKLSIRHPTSHEPMQFRAPPPLPWRLGRWGIDFSESQP